MKNLANVTGILNSKKEVRTCGKMQLKCGVNIFKDAYSKMPLMQILAIILDSNSKEDCMQRRISYINVINVKY